MDYTIHIHLPADTSKAVPTAHPHVGQETAANMVPVGQYDGAMDMYRKEAAELQRMNEDLKGQNEILRGQNAALCTHSTELSNKNRELVATMASLPALSDTQESDPDPHPALRGVTLQGKPRMRAPMFSDEQVWFIRREFKAGKDLVWIAKQLNSLRAIVARVARCQAYNWVRPEPERKPTVVKPGVGVVK